jgi:hypothetical protein
MATAALALSSRGEALSNCSWWNAACSSSSIRISASNDGVPITILSAAETIRPAPECTESGPDSGHFRPDSMHSS